MTRQTRGVVALTLALTGLASWRTGAQSLDEIVAAHVAARGGAARIRAVESLRTTGRATAGAGTEAVVTREVLRPGRIRTEVSFQGVTGVYACDGELGWQVSPFTGSLDPEPMVADQLQVALDQADIDGPFIDSAAKGVSVELVGKVPLDGRDAHKVKVTSKSGNVRYFYLDAASHLLVRTEATRLVRGHAVNVETTYGDHREVAGVMFPHAIEAGVSGRPRRLRIVVDRIEINPPLDEARFRAPAELGKTTVR